MRKQKRYLSFDPAEGYPTGDDLFYECLTCGQSLPSWPKKSGSCKCGNIQFDVDYGRIAINDHAKVRLFSSK